MKILYLITKSNFGGAQLYVHDLATYAQKLGHDVVVGFGGRGALKARLDDVGVRTISIPELERDIDPTNDMRSFFALLKLFAKERPDVIHLNSSKIGGLGALGARLHNAKEYLRGRNRKIARIIFTGHGWAFNEDRSDRERLIIGFLHWLTIQLSHKTIAVSRKTREQISRLPLVWHKLTVIHNGVRTIKTFSRKEGLLQIFGDTKDAWLGEKPLIIGTIAELHKNKGLNYAIEGIAQLKKQSSVPVNFVIIGEGEERFRLEQLVTQLGLKQVVFFAGQKDNASKLLSAFDIFLLPSITEAFPYVILEAGNAGLPVIATAVGGIPEVIDDMQSGILIQSKNPGEIARALLHLIEKPDRRELFGNAIHERIHGRFNVKQMAEKTLLLYSS